MSSLTCIGRNHVWPSTGSWSCAIALISNRVTSPLARLICVLAPCAGSQINRARGELTRFEMRAIAQDHDPVEGQAWFRTIPVNELIDGVTITPLCVC